MVKYEKIEEIIDNNYEIQNILKPLNSPSYYKVNELKEICIKLNISINEKITKTVLYDMISKHICNMIPNI